MEKQQPDELWNWKEYDIEYYLDEFLPDGWSEFFNNSVNGELMIAIYSEDITIPSTVDKVFIPFRLIRPEKIHLIILVENNVDDGIPFNRSQFVNDEINKDLGIHRRSDESFISLMKRFVFILPINLTSAKNNIQKKFIIELLKYLNSLPQPKVIMIWGNVNKKNNIHSYEKYFDGNCVGIEPLILHSSEPTAEEVLENFSGSGIFKKADKYLKENGVNVKWD